MGKELGNGPIGWLRELGYEAHHHIPDDEYVDITIRRPGSPPDASLGRLGIMVILPDPTLTLTLTQVVPDPSIVEGIAEFELADPELLDKLEKVIKMTFQRPVRTIPRPPFGDPALSDHWRQVNDEPRPAREKLAHVVAQTGI